MSDTPELRPGPPWAMEEMIAAQTALPAAICGHPAAAQIAAWVGAAATAGEPVRVVGCGTSEHAAMAGAAMLGEALPGVEVVRARDAFEASLDPRPAAGTSASPPRPGRRGPPPPRVAPPPAAPPPPR